VLEVALSLAGRCVILTNSEPGWVERCMRRFAPELEESFLQNHRLRVVYSEEALRRSRARSLPSCCWSGFVAWFAKWHEVPDEMLDQVERDELRTRGKSVGMEQEALAFYASGSWANIVSIGDACYERDALRGFSAVAAEIGCEAPRAKFLAVPAAPTVASLVRSLQKVSQTLRAHVRFDGPLDCDAAEEL